MKAQIIIEFSIMFAALAMLSLIVLQLISLKTDELKSESDMATLEGYGRSIQNEIMMAYNSKPGYQRNFSVPDKINDRDYNISLSNNYLILTQGSRTVFFALPDVQGSIKKGYNLIKNEKGRVEVN